MGLKKALDDYEQGQIDAKIAQGLSLRQIAKDLGRSRTAVAHYIEDPQKYGTRASPGRPKKLTSRDERRLFRAAGAGDLSAAKLREKLGLDVSKGTIINTLNSSSIFTYTKMNKAPRLKAHHITARVAWAERYVGISDESWARVFFSDEKKWNLDGPDGLKYYWHCLRNDEKVAFSRQNGGGSVMVWGAFYLDGTTRLAFLQGNQKAEDYVYTLSEYLLPVAFGKFGCDAIFQQDNASIHTAGITKAFFEDVALDVMTWPALSPDLNPIENVWGVLSNVVYGFGKQYDTTEELKRAVLDAWTNLDPRYLRDLVTGMRGRCIKVLKANGQHINM
jgi:transposase